LKPTRKADRLCRTMGIDEMAQMVRMRSLLSIGVAALLAPVAATPAGAACQLARYIELPVSMRGPRPLVSAQFGDKDAQFILDSGAFYSMVSRASAETYGLRLLALPPTFRLSGVNGQTSAMMTTVENFGLAGIRLPRVQFIVGGTDMGQVGLLGQNILGIGDTEYDIPHGAVRLLKATGCKGDEVAYWTSGRAMSTLALEPRTPRQPHTIGTVILNGVKLRAVFDTGAPTSILTLSAARRAGITPDSAGVVAAGMSTGIAAGATRAWLGSFTSIDIGGEIIPRPKIRFADIQMGWGDMLIGADFFLTHRIYVSNKTNRMYLTYEGGPMFGLTPTGAIMADGTKITLKDESAAPTDAAGYARRGSVSLSNHKPDAAIADFDKAIELAPKDASYLRLRAAARLANRQPLLAAGDLDKALALDPADIEAHGLRAAMRLSARDPAGASEDLRALDAALPPAAAQRLAVARMADAADLPELALANYDKWLASHKEDATRPVALNARCWLRGRLNRDLAAALDDCNAAVHARPNTAAYLDSRALIRFRQGDLAKALSDYDAALKVEPKAGWLLYARGLVKAKMGDTAGAKADRDAALALDARLPDRAKKFGLEG
jgi:predicted aspartyl protease/tetratricopeptide (TPR) repeat protein